MRRIGYALLARYVCLRREVWQLIDLNPALLDVTLDQLRTLLVVHETGSALQAARALGREQSSVQKQLDTLNRSFQRLCGELLVVKQGRGQDFLFTPTGQAAVELARSTLTQWLAGINDCRRRLGRTLTVGTTEFTLGFLGRIWERVADELTQCEVELKILHVRTKDFWTKLDSNQIDLLCGGFASTAGQTDLPDAYDFIEWHRDGLALLTNLSVRELPIPAVGVERLPAVPLVIPTGGVIIDFLERWYGPGYRNHLHIAANIDDIYYGLALLRSRLTYGCMIVSRSIGKAVVEGGLPGGPDFRLVDFASDFQPMLELVSGVFARKGERDQYEPTHPLNVLWEAFRQEARSGYLPSW
ncbi:MAG: LysR family transcriptional regulator [Egibacteraceae bacterium]